MKAIFNFNRSKKITIRGEINEIGQEQTENIN